MEDFNVKGQSRDQEGAGKRIHRFLTFLFCFECGNLFLLCKDSLVHRFLTFLFLDAVERSHSVSKITHFT